MARIEYPMLVSKASSDKGNGITMICLASKTQPPGLERRPALAEKMAI
jgi:hypothetical protein